MPWIGSVDTFIETAISGWAADSSDLSRQVAVEIWVNSALVATVPADRFREDLLQACIGDGCKAFQFDPRPYLALGGNNVEIRFAGSDVLVEKGRGRLVTLYSETLTSPSGSLLAALQSYYEFSPEHHILEMAPGSGRFLKTILETGLPFRRYTGVELSPANLADLQARFRDPRVEFSRTLSSRETADLVVSPAAACDLKILVKQNSAKQACFAIGFTEADPASEIRAALRESGIACLGLDSVCSGPGHGRELFAFGEKALAAGPPPLLAHIHVPKSAGTSLRNLLERYMGPKHVGLYVDDTCFVYSEAALRSWLLGNPAVRACSSHHIRSFPRWLAGREMRYVTVLRDPVEQFVSYMTHIRKHYATITAKTLLESVPPDAPRLSLREFAAWLLKNERDVPFRENHNVNFFSRYSSPGALDRLEAAKSALSEFFFVGIAERMDESVAKLHALAESAGLDFPPGPVGIENTSNEFRRDLGWIDPADEIGSMLLDSLRLDRQLYDWAVARLDENYWTARSREVNLIRQVQRR